VLSALHDCRLTASLPNFQPSTHLYSASSIQIRAQRERVFDLVQDVSRWPETLPHYRRVIDAGTDAVGRPMFRMAVRRGGLPFSWKSVCDIDDIALELRFEHLTGWTKGMKEVWTFTPTRDGTRAEIVDDLAFRVPPVALLVEPVLGVVLVRSLAKTSLSVLKQVAEKPAG
jgi:aromatase